ncbi:MAG: hypothetical protein MZU91_07710 [Desulfosudis oleivorans]|nr:hypothetical protein [Desulfosudis oleivorans]
MKSPPAARAFAAELRAPAQGRPTSWGCRPCSGFPSSAERPCSDLERAPRACRCSKSPPCRRGSTGLRLKEAFESGP